MRTLAQNIRLALDNPQVLHYYLDSADVPPVGNWVRTVVFYTLDSNGNDLVYASNSPYEINRNKLDLIQK